MRLLVVSQYFWPEAFRINDLVLGLQERGHRVSVLTGMPNYPSGRLFPGYRALAPRQEMFHGATVWRVPLLVRGEGQSWRLALNYLSFALSGSLLGPLRVKGDFDLIFVFEPSPITVGLPAIVLKWLKGVPIMFWVQDLWPESLSATGAVRSRFLLGGIERLVRYIYRRCDRILVQSEGFVDRVTTTGVDPGRILYFPNWAEGFYKPVEVEEDAPEGQELPPGFRLMFAGNIGSSQSFDTILSAAERLRDKPDIHWVIIGDGHKRQWVEDEVQRRRLSATVHLLGQRPPGAMPRYFALVDGLLVTLRRQPIFSLTIPSKLPSYLACAKPIIAALDGEGAKVVNVAGAGLTCPAEEVEGLAEAVLRLYRMSPEARQEMGRRGRAYFEAHFEREKLLDRLETSMQDLIGRRSCAS